jgi:hypothetical protein
MRAGTFAIALALVACGTPPPPVKPPVVIAQFDPSLAQPVLPLPNDLALDPDTGKLDVTDPSDANDAELAVNAWLRTLDGFPATSPASMTFSAEVDPTTVTPSSVLVFDITTSPPVLLQNATVTYEGLKLSVSSPWAPGRTYGVAVIAGDIGVKGAKGEAVVGTPAFDLIRAKYPLVTCSDLSDPSCRSANPGITGTSVADERIKALKMEKERLEAADIIDAIEAGGTPRESLALVWTFHTATESVPDGVVTFKPEVRAIPFPCDALLKDGHVALPAEPGDDALVAGTKADFSKLDGFSTTASIVTEHSMILGASGGSVGALQASQFHLIDLDRSNEDVPLTMTTKTPPDQVLINGVEPLRSHHRYAVVWTKGSSSLKTGEAWKLMTAGVAFTDMNGKSRVRNLDDASAQDLERMRGSVKSAMDAASAKSIAASDVLLAWTFTTQTTAETLVALRNKPAQWNLPTSVVGGPSNVVVLGQVTLLAQLSQLYGKDFNTQIRSAMEGRFVTGNAMDPNGTELDLTDPNNPVTVGTEGAFTDATLATPRQEQLIFTLFLPKTPKYMDGRIPVIEFQHGITRFRRDSAIVANTIAKYGFATLAIDDPMHGDRSYCTAATDCKDGNCANNRCPGGYAVDASDPLGTPLISGLKFGSTTNLAATRDQLRQMVIDTAQLIRVLQDTTNGIGAINVDDPATTTVTEKLEVAHLGYIGMSLGSLLGTLVVGANPEITAATFNVGGASPADIISQASVPFLANRKKQLDAFLLASRGLVKGTQAYDDFYIDGRWMLDPADGQNEGRTYIDEPLASYPPRRIFISWVKDDPWVPNPTTQLLINSIDHATAPMNFKQTQYISSGDHSFMMNPGGATVLQAQDDAVSWISTSF